MGSADGHASGIDEWPEAPLVFFHRGEVFGGAEEYLLFNASDLRQRGAQVVVVCSCDAKVAERFAESGIPIVVLGAGNRRSRLRRSLWGRFLASLEYRSKNLESAWGGALHLACVRAEVDELHGCLQELAPAVFVGNMTAVADYAFLRAAHLRGIPTLSPQHMTPQIGTGRRVTRECNRLCDNIISNSQWTRTHWIEQGLRADNHEVIYNRIEIDPVEVDPIRLRDRMGLNADQRVVASLGRLVSWKRFEMGLAAFSAIAGEFSQWHLAIIGDGPERAALERKTRDFKLESRVHFLGEIRAAARCLSQVDVLLHPTAGEHFGRGVAEAMLRETVVVGHASGGVLEMIDEGQNGFLGSDEQSLAAALRRGFTRHADTDLKRNARLKIEKLCGPSNSDRLAELLKALAGRRGRHVPN